jgi:hypothetical protein
MRKIILAAAAAAAILFLGSPAQRAEAMTFATPTQIGVPAATQDEGLVVKASWHGWRHRHWGWRRHHWHRGWHWRHHWHRGWHWRHHWHRGWHWHHWHHGWHHHHWRHHW